MTGRLTTWPWTANCSCTSASRQLSHLVVVIGSPAVCGATRVNSAGSSAGSFFRCAAALAHTTLAGRWNIGQFPCQFLPPALDGFLIQTGDQRQLPITRTIRRRREHTDIPPALRLINRLNNRLIC